MAWAVVTETAAPSRARIHSGLAVRGPLRLAPAWATSPVLRKWAATQVTETMSLDTNEKFKRLRLLRAFADEVGESELAATIRGFVGWARRDLLGQQGGEPERRALEQILEWATATVEFDLI